MEFSPAVSPATLKNITDTSKSIQIWKNQLLSHFLDQKEQKGKWYKIGSRSWCYKPLPTQELMSNFDPENDPPKQIEMFPKQVYTALFNYSVSIACNQNNLLKP